MRDLVLGLTPAPSVPTIPAEIVDGNAKMTLGMIWTIILRFAIQDISVEGEGKGPPAQGQGKLDGPGHVYPLVMASVDLEANQGLLAGQVVARTCWFLLL